MNKGKNLLQKIIIETYTPLHIGSGEILKESADFCPDSTNKIFVPDVQKILQSIKANDPNLNIYYKSSKLEDLITISGTQYGYHLPCSFNQNQVKSSPSHFEQKDQNKYPIEKNINNIREYVKDAFFRPLLPASSIKGAIRTAILAESLYQLSLDSHSRENGNPEKLFGSNPQQDILKAFKISDAYFTINDLELGCVKMANVCNNELKWKDLAGKTNKDSWQDTTGLYTEIIKAGSKTELLFSWDDFLLSNKGWMKGNPTVTKNIKDFEAFKDCLNQHALKMIQNEIDFFTKYEHQPVIEFYKELKSQIETNTDKAWLRMSWGGGWTGMTGLTKTLFDQDLKLKKYIKKQITDSLEKRIKKIRNLIVKEKLQKQIENLNKKNLYPKTRRLLEEKDKPPYCSLGWLSLSLASQEGSGTKAYRANFIPSSPLTSKPYPQAHSFSKDLAQAITKIKKENNIKITEEVLKGKALAEYWKNLSSKETKQKMLEEIKNYWKKQTWWDEPHPSKAQKKAKAIYETI